jgi:hypothetical protein
MKVQPIRNRHEVSLIDVKFEIMDIISISEETKLSIDQIIKVSQLMEYRRRTDAMIDDYDVTDANISGLDESLKQIAEAISGDLS